MDPREFEAFLAAKDRLSYLEAWLAARGVRGTRAKLGPATHFVVRFDRGRYRRGRPPRVFAAHYDRAPGTPGALDNSAACAVLARLAVTLADDDASRFGRHGAVILFTDAEELAEGGLVEQGAFAIASAFAERDEAPEVVVLDVAGRGDTVLVSESAVALARERAARLGGSDETAAATEELRARTLAALSEAGLRVLSAPLPYSDDLGFSAAGVPCVVLSVLPAAEADAYAAAVRARPPRRSDWTSIRAAAGPAFPPTWELLHTPSDTADKVDPASLALVARSLEALIQNAR